MVPCRLPGLLNQRRKMHIFHIHSPVRAGSPLTPAAPSICYKRLCLIPPHLCPYKSKCAITPWWPPLLMPTLHLGSGECFQNQEKPVLCNNTCQQIMPTDEYSKNKSSTQVSEIGMFPSTWILRWRYALPGQFSTHLSDSLVEDSTIKIQHWCDK